MDCVQREAEFGGLVGFMKFGFYSNGSRKLLTSFKRSDLYIWKVILPAVARRQSTAGTRLLV